MGKFEGFRDGTEVGMKLGDSVGTAVGLGYEH